MWWWVKVCTTLKFDAYVGQVGVTIATAGQVQAYKTQVDGPVARMDQLQSHAAQRRAHKDQVQLDDCEMSDSFAVIGRSLGAKQRTGLFGGVQFVCRKI